MAAALRPDSLAQLVGWLGHAVDRRGSMRCSSAWSTLCCAFPGDGAALSPLTLVVVFTLGVLFSVVAITPKVLGVVELSLLVPSRCSAADGARRRRGAGLPRIQLLDAIREERWALD